MQDGWGGDELVELVDPAGSNFRVLDGERTWLEWAERG